MIADRPDSEEEANELKLKLTKPCPKCGVRIQKNGGCPHMTCQQEIGGQRWRIRKPKSNQLLLIKYGITMITIAQSHSIRDNRSPSINRRMWVRVLLGLWRQVPHLQ